MPVRSFRVSLQNPSNNFKLINTTRHYCEGQWTDDNWPPPVIQPATNSGWQNESAGVMQGCEGYCKYDVHFVDQYGGDMRMGMIYVYWTNPFMGSPPGFWFASSVDDVWPQCDFQPSSGQFPPDDTTKVNFQFGFVDFVYGDNEGGQINSPAGLDLIPLAAAGPIYAPLYVVGLAPVIAHPILTLRVDSTSQPVPPAFGTGFASVTNIQQLTGASLSDWVGHWGNGQVDVNIVQTPNGQLSATIRDPKSPPLAMTEAFVPGPSNLAAHDTSVLGTLVRLYAKSPDQVSAYMKAAQGVIDKSTIGASPAASPKKGIGAVSGVAMTTPGEQVIQRAIAPWLKPNTGVAYLSHGVMMQLYATFNGDVRMGTEILYSRVGIAGILITSAKLENIPRLT